jgi:hypothetical protein
MISQSELLRFTLSRSARNEVSTPLGLGPSPGPFPRFHLSSLYTSLLDTGRIPKSTTDTRSETDIFNGFPTWGLLILLVFFHPIFILYDLAERITAFHIISLRSERSFNPFGVGAIPRPFPQVSPLIVIHKSFGYRAHSQKYNGYSFRNGYL